MTAGLLVIGSGPAGTAAAEAFREHDPDAPIRILTADSDQPYARPPLSKDFLQGSSDDIDLHPSSWYHEHSIELILNTSAQTLDVTGRAVVANGQRFAYDALVLATGADPVPVQVPGAEFALQLRSADDARRLRAAAADAATAVVIGAGFIGCEAAASLAAQGLSVTLVAPEPAPQNKRLGELAGERLRNLVERSGVRFVAETKVQAIQQGAVLLDDGTRLDADLVLAATGVAPQSRLAEAAGLEVRNSRIVVGSDMRTSAPDVFAAGDVTLAYNDAAGRHLAVEHWQDAVDQGEIAGAAAAGQPSRWNSVPGFWSTIGGATVKHHAWGDGYEHARLVEHGGGFTIWYSGADAAVVGVLTYNADEDYDAGATLIEHHAPQP